MKIKILTIFPEMFDSVFGTSILKRAREARLIEIECIDIRPFSDRKHKNTDDAPFGGGAGMVMLPQPIADAMKFAMGEDFHGKRIFMGPRGKTLTQNKVKELSSEEELILLCGHYEGVDQRVLDHYIDEEISIGDYILTGGELAAMVLVDSVARLIPGVLGCEESPEEESFSEGLLEYPQYTRPREWEGEEVPEVLLNGYHAKITQWRREKSLEVTLKMRPDLLESAPLTKKDLQYLQKLREENGCS